MTSTFVFQAISSRGDVNDGFLDAADPEQARSILAARGLFVLSIVDRGSRRSRRDPISATDLALGLRVLADLLDSGLPVSRALQTLEDLAPKPWKRALPGMRQSVREGHSLADALAGASVRVPPLVIGIAQAGEAGSGLANAVRRAAELTEATAETQSAVRAALAYPTVVGAAGVCAVGVLLTVVLPRFARILTDLGQALPASTRFVVEISALARAAFLPSFAVAALGAIVWGAWASTEVGRRDWHRFLLRLPMIGGVRRAIAAARMAHSLGALLESGVPLPRALTFAARATNDGAIQERLNAARAAVTAGQPLSSALETSGSTTLTVVRLVRAGEESGRLAEMLRHAAKIEQQRADRVIRTAVRMLEPMLLLTFASIVALVAAALLQAIYSVRPTA